MISTQKNEFGPRRRNDRHGLLRATNPEQNRLLRPAAELPRSTGHSPNGGRLGPVGRTIKRSQRNQKEREGDEHDCHGGSNTAREDGRAAGASQLPVAAD